MTDTLALKLSILADLLGDIADDSFDTSLDRVKALRLIRDNAESALRTAVPIAMGSGATWAQVGTALDTSPQAAHQRYGHLR